MDFESAGFWKDHFGVTRYWSMAAIIGGALPVIAFVVTLFWWLKCKPLWRANERAQRTQPQDVQIDRGWLG